MLSFSFSWAPAIPGDESSSSLRFHASVCKNLRATLDVPKRKGPKKVSISKQERKWAGGERDVLGAKEVFGLHKANGRNCFGLLGGQGGQQNDSKF